MTSKYGTGEEIGRIEISEELEIVIRDDGDNDSWVNVYFETSSRTRNIHVDLPLRDDIGDEKLAKDLENLEGDNYTSLL